MIGIQLVVAALNIHKLETSNLKIKILLHQISMIKMSSLLNNRSIKVEMTKISLMRELKMGTMIIKVTIIN